MAEQQYEVGVRLKGDGSGLVGATAGGTDAMRALEEQAKRTSGALGEVARAKGAARTEGTAVKQVLDAQREAFGGLTRDTGAYTSGTLAATAAAQGLRGVISGVLGVIGGPTGIIALLATAALGWLSFGNAATDAADQAEDAARRARSAAEDLARDSTQANIGAYIASYGADITYLQGKLENTNSPEVRARIEARIEELKALQRQLAEGARLSFRGGGSGDPAITIEQATKGLRTANTLLAEYEKRVEGINRAFGAKMGETAQNLALTPEERMAELARLDAERQAFMGAARRQYDSGLAGLNRQSPEELAAQRELERLKKLQAQSAEEDLKAQHAMIEANDVLIRQAAERARKDRERLEQAGEKSAVDDLLAQERALQSRDELIRRSALGEREVRERLEQDIAKQREEGLKRAAAEQQRMAENLERSLTDATVDGLIKGFRRGEDALENFIRRMEEAFAAALLTPIIQPIVRPIAQGMSGVGQGIARGIFGGVGFPGVPGFGGGTFGASGGGTAGGAGGGMGGGMGGLGAMFGGSQFFADFGNFFGNVGSVTETGAIFGLGDATAGFLGANPWLPWIGPGLQFLSGDTKGGLISAGLTAAGFAVGGPVGGAIGATIGGLMGGGGKKDRRASAGYVAGFGEDLGWGALSQGRYVSSGTHAGLLDFGRQQALTEQNLIRNLNLRPEQVAAVNQALAGTFHTRHVFAAGKDAQLDPAALEQVAAERLQAISSALGRSIEELTGVMAMSAEQWGKFIEQMEASVRQAELTLAQHVRALPGMLGITGLEQFQRSLDIAEFRSPLDRLGAARGGFEGMLARARGGDLDAVRDLPRYAQDLLGIGRDTYASGAEFQSILGSVERSIAEVKSTQEGLLADITKDFAITMIETSRNQVAAIHEQTSALAAKLDEVKDELERLRSGT